MESGANPWMPTSPCDTGCIPPPELPVGVARTLQVMRAASRLTAVAAVLGAGVLLAVVVPVLGPPVMARIQRRWALTLVAAAGLRLRRRGPAGPAGGALVVANHVSWLDVLALHAVAPVRMLAKTEVRTWPIIGPMAARAGTVFLDRDRLRALPGAVDDMAGVLAAGVPIGVFAEGTTRCGRELGPFRPAAFQAAIDAGVPVQPVALAYRVEGDDAPTPDPTAAFVGDDTLLTSLWRVTTAPQPLILEVVVLPQLDPARPDPARLDPAQARGEGVDLGGSRTSGYAGPRRALAHHCAALVAASLDLTPAGTVIAGGAVGASAVPSGGVPSESAEPVTTACEDREAFDRVA